MYQTNYSFSCLSGLIVKHIQLFVGRICPNYFQDGRRTCKRAFPVLNPALTNFEVGGPGLVYKPIKRVNDGGTEVLPGLTLWCTGCAVSATGSIHQLICSEEHRESAQLVNVTKHQLMIKNSSREGVAFSTISSPSRLELLCDNLFFFYSYTFHLVPKPLT